MITHQNLNIDPYYLNNPMAYQQFLQQQAAMQRNATNQMYNREPQQARSLLVPARIIPEFNDIKPNEVPSDGTPACFLQNDYSCVYVRAVNAQGTIDTVRYVPEVVEKPKEEVQNDSQADVIARLERIEQMLERNNKSHYPPRKNHHHKSNNQKPQNKEGE